MAHGTERKQAVSERIGKRQQADAKLLEMFVLDELPNQRISAKEQRQYGRKIARGDEAAKQEYILRRLRFAMMIAMNSEAAQPESSSLTVEDHFQNVIEAMKTIMDEYNPKKDKDFARYMGWSFRLAEKTYKETAEIIRLPSHILEKLAKLEKTERRTQRLLTEEEAALAMSVSQEEAIRLLQTRENQKSGLLPIEEAEDPPDPEPSLIDQVGNRIIREKWQTAIAKLPDREQRILQLRLGLDDKGEPMTLKEVGEYFNMSHERIRQIENQALYKLGQLFDARELYETLEQASDIGYFGKPGLSAEEKTESRSKTQLRAENHEKVKQMTEEKKQQLLEREAFLVEAIDASRKEQRVLSAQQKIIKAKLDQKWVFTIKRRWLQRKCKGLSEKIENLQNEEQGFSGELVLVKNSLAAYR